MVKEAREAIGKELAFHLERGTRPDGRTKRWLKRDFAKELRVSESTIGNWTNGHSILPLLAIERVLFGENPDKDDQQYTDWRAKFKELHAAAVVERNHEDQLLKLQKAKSVLAAGISQPNENINLAAQPAEHDEGVETPNELLDAPVTVAPDRDEAVPAVDPPKRAWFRPRTNYFITACLVFIVVSAILFLNLMNDSKPARDKSIDAGNSVSPVKVTRGNENAAGEPSRGVEDPLAPIVNLETKRAKDQLARDAATGSEESAKALAAWQAGNFSEALNHADNAGQSMSKPLIEQLRIKGILATLVGQFALATDAYKKLVALDPEANENWMMLGSLEIWSGRPLASREYFKKVIEKDDGRGHGFKQLAQFNLLTTGLFSDGNFATVKNEIESALDDIEQRAKVDPLVAQWAAYFLGAAKMALCEFSRSTAKYEDTVSLCQAALKQAKMVADADAVNPRLRTTIVQLDFAIGDTLLKSGKAEEALSWFNDGRSVVKSIAGNFPHDPAWKSLRAEGDYYLGDYFARKLNWKTAENYYQDGIHIQEQLLAGDHDNVILSPNLNTAHIKLGDVVAQQGREADALAQYQLALAGSDRLLETAPQNAMFQHDVAVVDFKLGETLFRQNEYDQAYRFFKSAFADLQNSEAVPFLAESTKFLKAIILKNMTQTMWRMAEQSKPASDSEVSELIKSFQNYAGSDEIATAKFLETELSNLNKLVDLYPANNLLFEALAKIHQSLALKNHSPAQHWSAILTLLNRDESSLSDDGKRLRDQAKSNLELLIGPVVKDPDPAQQRP